MSLRNPLPALALVCVVLVSEARAQELEVEVGQDDWIFLAGSTLACCDGGDVLDRERLELWTAALEARRAWCLARDVEYVPLIVPDKHHVYPEKLADGSELAAGPTCLDRLFEYLGEESELGPIDLRPLLVAEKGWGLLYYPLGSHWNDRGAFVAYEAVMGLLGMKPFPREDHLPYPTGDAGDTLEAAAGIQAAEPQEAIALVPDPPREAKITEAWPGAHGLVDGIVTHPLRDQPRAVLLRDSFGNWLWYFLAEHFSEMRIDSTSGFDPLVLEGADPDVVIDQWVDRLLVANDPELPGTEEQRERDAAWLAGQALAEENAEANAGAPDATLEAGASLALGGDFDDLPSRLVPCLRLEIAAEAEGRVAIEYERRGSASLRPVELRAGHQWLFVPLDKAKRTDEPGVAIEADVPVRVVAWELRAIDAR